MPAWRASAAATGGLCVTKVPRVPGRDGVDQRERGAAAVEDHDLAAAQQRRGRARDGALALDLLRLPALVAGRHARASERAAVHALHGAVARQLVEVAADRVARHAEGVLQLGGDDAPARREQVEDARLALLLEQRPAGHAGGQLLDAGHDELAVGPGDPDHLVGSGRRTSDPQDRVAVGQQPARDRVEDLLEGVVADAAAAGELDQRERQRLAGDRHVAGPEGVEGRAVHGVDVGREPGRVVARPRSVRARHEDEERAVVCVRAHICTFMHIYAVIVQASGVEGRHALALLAQRPQRRAVESLEGVEARRGRPRSATPRRPRRRRGRSGTDCGMRTLNTRCAVALGEDLGAARVGEQDRVPRPQQADGRRRLGVGQRRAREVDQLLAVLGGEAAQPQALERRRDGARRRRRPSWRSRRAWPGRSRPGSGAPAWSTASSCGHLGRAEPVLGQREEVRAAALPRARRRDAHEVRASGRPRPPGACPRAPRSRRGAGWRRRGAGAACAPRRSCRARRDRRGWPSATTRAAGARRPAPTASSRAPRRGGSSSA